MIGQTPNFIDSPYLIIDEYGWRLQDDAPAELKKEFEEYMKSLELTQEENWWSILQIAGCFFNEENLKNAVKSRGTNIPKTF